MSELVFTPVAILDMLQQIQELDGLDKELVENEGTIQLRIGESLYNIDTSSAEDVYVPEEVVADISEINESEYPEIVDADYTADMVNYNKSIESGIIKEVAKTLLVGGLVRLTSKLLKR